MLGAWLFLPMAGFSLSALPDITKMSVTCVSVFIGIILFDAERLLKLRLNVTDWAILTWLFVPLPSALSNGYGAYEGLAGLLSQSVSWGMPYVIGRLYFGEISGLRELAIGIFIGGIVYVPLVLMEARLSPQLHTWVYGFHQHSFDQARRGDGWRPTVFMQHGLAVAMFMSTAALCGIWLCSAGRLRFFSFFSIAVPTSLLSIVVLAVAAACRSTYALMLMITGIIALFASRWLKTRILLAGLLAVAPAYIILRTVGGWDAQILRDLAATVGQDREGSLGVRLDSEDALWRWMQGSLLFGHGRIAELMIADREVWGRFIPDGLWLTALGKYGVVGLTAMLGALLLPPLIFLRRFRPGLIMGPDLAGATALGLVLILYAMDNLLNAMVNPVYLMVAGGLSIVKSPSLGAPQAPCGLSSRRVNAIRAVNREGPDS